MSPKTQLPPYGPWAPHHNPYHRPHQSTHYVCPHPKELHCVASFLPMLSIERNLIALLLALALPLILSAPLRSVTRYWLLRPFSVLWNHPCFAMPRALDPPGLGTIMSPYWMTVHFLQAHEGQNVRLGRVAVLGYVVGWVAGSWVPVDVGEWVYVWTMRAVWLYLYAMGAMLVVRWGLGFAVLVLWIVGMGLLQLGELLFEYYFLWWSQNWVVAAAVVGMWVAIQLLEGVDAWDVWDETFGRVFVFIAGVLYWVGDCVRDLTNWGYHVVVHTIVHCPAAGKGC